MCDVCGIRACHVVKIIFGIFFKISVACVEDLHGWEGICTTHASAQAVSSMSIKTGELFNTSVQFYVGFSKPTKPGIA